MMSNFFKKTFAALTAAILLLAAVPVNTHAAGFYVSASSLSLTVGSSGGFTFGATDAVGAFEVSTDGGVSAEFSGSAWVEDMGGTNTTVYITVTANTIGTGHVYVTVYDGTSTDGDDLSGKTYTVTVTVTQPTSGVYNGSTNSSSSETTKATTTAAQTTTETTTVDPEIELLTVVVDDTEMLILKDLTDAVIPDGFELSEAEYNGVTVQTMVYSDMVLYVLQNTEDDTTDYYTLNDETGEFEPLRYTTITGAGFCIFLDFPDDMEIPYGYSLIETEIYGFNVEALAISESSESVSLTAYSITPDDLAADPENHYFVYCLLAGEEVLCDYDTEYDILERCVSLKEIEEPTTEAVTETETETEAEELTGWAAFSDLERGLIIAIIVIALILIVLAVILFILLRRKGGGPEEPDEPDDESYAGQDSWQYEENEEEERFEPFVEDGENAGTAGADDTQADEVAEYETAEDTTGDSGDEGAGDVDILAAVSEVDLNALLNGDETEKTKASEEKQEEKKSDILDSIVEIDLDELLDDGEDEK